MAFFIYEKKLRKNLSYLREKEELMQYKILETHTQMPIENFFRIGKRDGNAKRNFLFLSKVIGKHLETNPKQMRDVASDLVTLVPWVEKEDLCIGFAETATGLAMEIASQFGCSYISTTRDCFDGKIPICFEEEHSHATTHHLYLREEKRDRIVLVDDEITTGNSMMNVIVELKKRTGAKKYTVLSILNWMNEAQKKKVQKLEKREGIRIIFQSLFVGEITEIKEETFTSNDYDICDTHHKGDMLCLPISMQRENQRLCLSGRSLMNHEDFLFLQLTARRIANRLDHILKKEWQNLVILGHGEHIYLPFLVALRLGEKRKNVCVKTTTRSPIVPDQTTIFDRTIFQDSKGETYSIYNKKLMEAADAVLFLSETDDIEQIEVPKLTSNLIPILLKEENV